MLNLQHFQVRENFFSKKQVREKIPACNLSTCMSFIILLIELLLKKVLVHGSAEATDHLKQHCLKHLCQHVYAPHIDETIDVTSDLSAYKVC